MPAYRGELALVDDFHRPARGPRTKTGRAALEPRPLNLSHGISPNNSSQLFPKYHVLHSDVRASDWRRNC